MSKNRPLHAMIRLLVSIAAATVLSVAVLKFLDIRDLVLSNSIFFLSLSGLIVLGRHANYSLVEIVIVICVYLISCIVLFFVGLSLVESHWTLSGILAAPVEQFGYYPPGPDLMLLIGTLIWMSSIYVICLAAIFTGLAVNTQIARITGRPA